MVPYISFHQSRCGLPYAVQVNRTPVYVPMHPLPCGGMEVKVLFQQHVWENRTQSGKQRCAGHLRTTKAARPVGRVPFPGSVMFHKTHTRIKAGIHGHHAPPRRQPTSIPSKSRYQSLSPMCTVPPPVELNPNTYTVVIIHQNGTSVNRLAVISFIFVHIAEYKTGRANLFGNFGLYARPVFTSVYRKSHKRPTNPPPHREPSPNHIPRKRPRRRKRG